jgi:hypothetical protein
MDWKLYLQKKAITLQDFVDDHAITDPVALRATFTKMKLTLPLDSDPRVKEIRWYVKPASTFDNVIVVKSRGPMNNG